MLPSNLILSCNKTHGTERTPSESSARAAFSNELDISRSFDVAASFSFSAAPIHSLPRRVTQFCSRLIAIKPPEQALFKQASKQQTSRDHILHAEMTREIPAGSVDFNEEATATLPRTAAVVSPSSAHLSRSSVPVADQRQQANAEINTTRSSEPPLSRSETSPQDGARRRERDTAAQGRRRERCCLRLKAFGRLCCKALEYFIVFIVILLALPVFADRVIGCLLELVLCGPVYLLAYFCCKPERAGGDDASETTRRAQLHGQLVKRQCLAVESCQTDALIPETWGDNALEKHTSSETVYWPIIQEAVNDEYACYLFSKPLSIVQMLEPVSKKDDTKDGATAAGSTPQHTKSIPTVPFASEAETKGNGQAMPCVPEDDIELAAIDPGSKPETREVVAEATDKDCCNQAPESSYSSQQRDSTTPLNEAPNLHNNETTRDGAVCDICLANFQVGSYVAWSKNANCRHAFHVDCVLDWLLQQPTCPTCRQDYIILHQEHS